MKIDPKQVIGDRYGKLVIIDARREGQNIICKCKCDCGYIKDNIRLGNMRSGHIKSCGNHYKEYATHTHGMSGSRIYRIYRKMLNRCYREQDESYKYYGAKGIRVCDEWKNNSGKFIEWALSNGYDDTLSIDRIDTNGDYEPDNCRWITMHEQCLNRKTNIHLEYRGETKTVTEWAEALGMDRRLIYDRLKRGWNTEDALSRPKEIDGIRL